MIRPGLGSSFLEFENSDKHESAELGFCPVAGLEKFLSSMVSQISGGIIELLTMGGMLRAPQHA